MRPLGTRWLRREQRRAFIRDRHAKVRHVAKLPDTASVLADLTDLARRKIITYVLPGVPFGTGFTLGTQWGAVFLETEAAEAFITTAAQAGAWS